MNLQPGDKVFCINYGYVTVESVLPYNLKYPLSQLVETNRGRKDYRADRPILGVKRES